MSTIKLRRSAVEGKIPLAEDLELGELAINTFDGKLYLKKSVSGANSIIDVTAGTVLTSTEILDQIKTVDGTGSGLDADLLDSLDSTQFLRSDTSDTLSGSLIVTGSVDFGVSTLKTESGSTSSITQTSIASFAVATYGSGKFIIQASDNVSGEVHVTEMLVVHDGATASATEYGTIHTGATPLATYDVDINAGNVRVLATAATTNSTTYKVTENLIDV